MSWHFTLKPRPSGPRVKVGERGEKSQRVVAGNNPFYFQQHSDNSGLTTCVFIHIPALSPSFPERPFIFIDIRASFGKN